MFSFFKQEPEMSFPLCADLMNNRSRLFKDLFIPIRCLFNDNDEDVILATCHRTVKTVSVEVYHWPENYDVREFQYRGITHPKLTSLIEVIPDLEAELFYAVSESPAWFTLQNFAKYICKTRMDIHRNLHCILKQLIPLFSELNKNGYGVCDMKDQALVVDIRDGVVEVKLRREMIDYWPSEEHTKNSLISIARLFSDIYTDVTDCSKLLPLEIAFFKDCMDDSVSLEDLQTCDYFNGDPNEWKENEFVESDESFDVIDEIPDATEAVPTDKDSTGDEPVIDIPQSLYDVSALIQNTVSEWRLW